MSKNHNVILHVCNELREALEDESVPDSIGLLKALASLLEAGYVLPHHTWISK